MPERSDRTMKEVVVEQVKATGILPCIKLKKKTDYLAYAQAMYEGGARVVEVTMTTPGALEAIEAISTEFKGRLWLAAGTVLDATSCREVILHGGHIIVNPCLNSEIIKLANGYGVPVFSGAFSATEVYQAMQAGATMVKIFPAKLGGPGYMTNLKMVYPEVNLIPSGGISLENAADFIRCGACAVSGARTFMNPEMVQEHGLGWITRQVRQYIDLIQETKKNLPELP